MNSYEQIGSSLRKINVEIDFVRKDAPATCIQEGLVMLAINTSVSEEMQNLPAIKKAPLKRKKTQMPAIFCGCSISLD